MLDDDRDAPRCPARPAGRSTRPTTTDRRRHRRPGRRPGGRPPADPGPGPGPAPRRPGRPRPARVRPRRPPRPGRGRTPRPRPAARQPSRSTTWSADSTARGSAPAGTGPAHSRRTPSASSVWNSVSSKSIGSLTSWSYRAGRGRVGSLGRPRIRSPTMLRWIWEVPAAMVREMPRSQSSTMVAGREGAQPVERRRRRRRPGRPGPAGRGRTRPACAGSRCRPA